MARTPKPYVPVPDAERCEFMVHSGYYYGRCDKRAKYTVSAWQSREQEGDPRQVQVCGVHKRVADRGGQNGIFLRKEKYSERSIGVYFKATDVEALKAELANVKMRQKWDRGKPASARTQAGRAMFEQAPEILEMLFMVAERGDTRAWAAIETIQQGMSDVEKADAEYQAILDKIEALKAKIEEAKGEQA